MLGFDGQIMVRFPVDGAWAWCVRCPVDMQGGLGIGVEGFESECVCQVDGVHPCADRMPAGPIGGGGFGWSQREGEIDFGMRVEGQSRHG